MEFLDHMMKQYLESNQSEQEQKTQLQQQYGSSLNASLHKNQKPNLDQELIDLKDNFTASFLKEMGYNPLEQIPEQSFEFLPPLWSMEPRIFALETSSSGKRKYIVGNLGRFMNHYWRKSDRLNRHYYELIRENTPCRLYFGR